MMQKEIYKLNAAKEEFHDQLDLEKKKTEEIKH